MKTATRRSSNCPPVAEEGEIGTPKIPRSVFIIEMNPLLDETSSSSSSFVRHRVHQYFLFNRARDRDRQTFVFNFEMKKKKEKKKKKNWVPFLTPSTMRYISHL
jgi:hypothetical protein